MSEHTKGPWHRNVKPARKYCTIFAGWNKHVARVVGDGLADKEVEANCDLIAATPDLLEALQATLTQFDFGENFPSDHPIVAARAAIAKATGAA